MMVVARPLTDKVGVDLFCGAGGATTGMQATGRIRVEAAVNHDEFAIKSHEANNKGTTHWNEDVRGFRTEVLPKDVFILWVSSECTHLSNAKGGTSRDADSRTLSEEIPRFVNHCGPKYIAVENVREFMSWGPLIEKRESWTKVQALYGKKKGKLVRFPDPNSPLVYDKDGSTVMVPDKRWAGIDYDRWVDSIKAMGYEFDYQLLNSADFGAATSRLRYFGVFRKKGLPMRWPKQTHAKDPKPASGLLKWKPIRPLLDLENQGQSIFNREERGLKDLVPRTIERLEWGLNRHVAGGENQFILRYSFNNKPSSIEDPIGTIVAKRDQYLVSVEETEISSDNFILKAYGGHNSERHSYPLTDPSHTITTWANHKLVSVKTMSHEWLVKWYNAKQNQQGLEGPLHTITTKDRFALVKAQMLTMFYGRPDASQPLSVPLNTITTANRFALTEAQFIHAQYGGPENSTSADAPLPTIVVNPKHSLVTVTLDNGEEAVLRKIGNLYVSPNIVDIKMRMLTVDELKVAQGFPEDYILLGSDEQKKKFIGNSVVPLMAELLTESILDAYEEYELEMGEAA